MSSINPVTAPQTPGEIAAASNTTGSNSLSDPNTFLKLLVSELQYQDPSNPTDPNQYMAQTAQFAMVQKMNDMDTQMTAMLTASQQAAAASLIGRQIVGTTAAGASATGVVTGLQIASSGPLLVVNGQSVPMGNVTSVTTPGSATSPTPTSAATPTDTGTTGTSSTSGTSTDSTTGSTSTTPPATPAGQTSTTPATPAGTTPPASTTQPA